MAIPWYVIILVVAAVGVVVGVVNVMHGPVSRGRLERFARRQKLTVTASNGNQIIAYLAITRRWRVAGIVAGILAPTVWTAGVTFGVSVVPVFAGWFAGALIAEARVAHRAVGPRRAASLRARRPLAYLSRFSWALLPATAGLSVALAIVTAVTAYLGRTIGYVSWANPDWTAALWPGVALAVAIVVRLTQLRILRRPQPHAEADVIAGDDAIRSRSMHVLAGGGAALVLCCVSAQLGALNLDPSHITYVAVTIIRGLSIIAIPALGWNVGTWAWRVRRDPTGLARPA